MKKSNKNDVEMSQETVLDSSSHLRNLNKIKNRSPKSIELFSHVENDEVMDNKI